MFIEVGNGDKGSKTNLERFAEAIRSQEKYMIMFQISLYKFESYKDIKYDHKGNRSIISLMRIKPSAFEEYIGEVYRCM